MNRNIVETIIGALILIIATYFFYHAYNSTLTIKNGEDQYTLFGRFDRTDGVNLGGDVRIAGIRVGKIVSQNLDPKTFQAILELSIRKDISLPSDTSAEIIGNGLLGEKYVALIPGADDEQLKDKAFIQFTQSSISIESLIGKFMFGMDKDKSKDKDKDKNNTTVKSDVTVAQ